MATRTKRKRPADTTETRWARKLNAEYKSVLAQMRKTVEMIVTFGQHLNQAKDEIGHGKWGEFVRKSLDVSHDRVSQYIAVAGNSVLANFANSRNLPASLDKLYALSRLPEPVLIAAFERGDVHLDITLAQIDKLNLRPQPPLKALAQDITLAATFASRRGIVVAATQVYLSKGQVRAFTGESGIIWSIPGWSLDETVAVDAKDLVRTLNDLVEGGWREINVSVQDDTLIVQAGTARHALALLTSDVEPEIKTALQMEPPREGMPVSSDFWEALARVEAATSGDTSKPALTGVYWSGTGELMASDNYRISVCRSIPCPMDGGLLIPKYFLNMLGNRRSEFTTLAVVDDMLWLLHERGAVYTRLLQGAAFPFEGVRGYLTKTREIAETSATRITVLADPERSLDRVAKRAAVRDGYTCRIQVHAADGSLTVSVLDEDDATVLVEDRVLAEVVGDPVSFAVNGKMFLDALKIGRTFWYTPDSPILVQSDDGQVEHLLALLGASADRDDLAVPEVLSAPRKSDLLAWVSRYLWMLQGDLTKLIDKPAVRDDPRAVEIRKMVAQVCALSDKVFGAVKEE